MKRIRKRPISLNGGIAIPIKKNMYLLKGRTHEQGGIDLGNVEAEGNEVVKQNPKSLKVFSKVNMLGGKSPAELVLKGADENKVFNAQQNYKQINHLNDDGTKKYKMGGLKRNEDYGSKKKPYPSVNKKDFAGSNRSYPIPTRADAVDALRLAGLHGRSDIRAKVYAKYPELRKARVGGLYSLTTNEGTRLRPFSTGEKSKAKLGINKVLSTANKYTKRLFFGEGNLTDKETATDDETWGSAISKAWSGKLAKEQRDLDIKSGKAKYVKLYGKPQIIYTTQEAKKPRFKGGRIIHIAGQLNRTLKDLGKGKKVADATKKTVETVKKGTNVARKQINPLDRIPDSPVIKPVRNWSPRKQLSYMARDVPFFRGSNLAPFNDLLYHSGLNALKIPKTLSTINKTAKITKSGRNIRQTLDRTKNFIRNKWGDYKPSRLAEKYGKHLNNVSEKRAFTEIALGVGVPTAYIADSTLDYIAKNKRENNYLNEIYNLASKDITNARYINNGDTINFYKKRINDLGLDSTLTDSQLDNVLSRIKREKDFNKESLDRIIKDVKSGKVTKPKNKYIKDDISDMNEHLDKSSQAGKDIIKTANEMIERNKDIIKGSNKNNTSTVKRENTIKSSTKPSTKPSTRSSTNKSNNTNSHKNTINNNRRNRNKANNDRISKKDIIKMMNEQRKNFVEETNNKLLTEEAPNIPMGNSINKTNVRKGDNELAEIRKLDKDINNADIRNKPIESDDYENLSRRIRKFGKPKAYLGTYRPRNKGQYIEGVEDYNDNSTGKKGNYNINTKRTNYNLSDKGQIHDIDIAYNNKNTSADLNKVSKSYNDGTLNPATKSNNLNKILNAEPLKARTFTPIKENNIAKSSATKFNNLGFNTADAISLAGNIGGGLINYLSNKSAIDHTSYRSAPTPRYISKLKTNININPQVDAMKESAARYERLISGNSLSSRAGINRIQSDRLRTLNDYNKLRADKENLETDLINKDRLNQQDIINKNIEDYNDWSAAKNTFDNNKIDKYAENRSDLIGTVNSGIQNTISNIEQRQKDNQTMLAYMAAHPNVNPEMLKALGIKGITDKMIRDWYKANKK